MPQTMQNPVPVGAFPRWDLPIPAPVRVPRVSRMRAWINGELLPDATVPAVP